MIEVVAACAALTCIVLGGLASRAVHAWLELRERERFSATDKAELLERIKQIDAKLLDLKNRDFGGGRRTG